MGTTNKKGKIILIVCLIVLLVCAAVVGVILLTRTNSSPNTPADSETQEENEGENEGEGEKDPVDTLEYAFSLLNKENAWEELETPEASLDSGMALEPGAVAIHYFKIENSGTLPLDWHAYLSLKGEECGELAKVLTVYVRYSEEEKISFSRADLATDFYELGSLCDVLAVKQLLRNNAIESGKTVYLSIALQMSEEAGNVMQGAQTALPYVRFIPEEPIRYASSDDRIMSSDFRVSVTLGGEPGAVVPGDVLPYTVTVNGQGTYDRFMRVTVSFSQGAVWGRLFRDDFASEVLGDLKNAVLDPDSVTKGEDDTISFTLYVDRVVKPGETVTVLEKLRIPTSLSQEDLRILNEGFTVNAVAEIVQADAVGVEDLTDADAEDAMAAFAYFAAKYA